MQGAMTAMTRTFLSLLAAAALALPALPALAATADEIARGKYVFGATGGGHTEPNEAVNRGGRRYDGPFGTGYSGNIAPDRETAIGGWTDDQIIAAARLGRRPNGERLIPVDPYTVFKNKIAK